MANSVFCIRRHRRKQSSEEREGEERARRPRPAPPCSPVQAPQLPQGRASPGPGWAAAGTGLGQGSRGWQQQARCGLGRAPWAPSPPSRSARGPRSGLGRAPGTRPGVRRPRASPLLSLAGPGAGWGSSCLTGNDIDSAPARDKRSGLDKDGVGPGEGRGCAGEKRGSWKGLLGCAGLCK
ncbi:hypothetical protein H8959_012908 [Pygathrix nigripes]